MATFFGPIGTGDEQGYVFHADMDLQPPSPGAIVVTLDCKLLYRALLPFHLRQESEHDRPRRLVLLQVDQQLAEGPGLRVPPELADPLGPVEVRETEDVEELGASRWGEGLEACPEPRLHLLERSRHQR
jgi:hypothetical protein